MSGEEVAGPSSSTRGVDAFWGPLSALASQEPDAEQGPSPPFRVRMA